MAQGSYRKFGETQVAKPLLMRVWVKFIGLITAVNKTVVGLRLMLSVLHRQGPAFFAQLEADSETWAKVSTGWEAYAEHMDTLAINTKACEVLFPEAQDMAFLAQFAYAEGKAVAAEESEPVYLRDKVTWKKLPGRE